MAELRPVTADMFDQVAPLLAAFPGSSWPPEVWRRMLFDLPWPVEEPLRGYALMDRGQTVGFLGTIFSRRRIAGETHRFCNLSSWIVSPSHRDSSMQLLLPVLALRDTTLVNLTASPTAHEIFVRLRFHTLEENQWLIVPLASPAAWLPSRSATTFTDLDEMRPHLDVSGQALLADMRNTVAAQALIRQGGRVCHLIATSTRWKGRWRLAHVHYASDWELFWGQLPAAARAFARTLRTVGLRVDARFAGSRRPAWARKKALELPTLYRPARPEITPERVDALYTELVGQPP